MVGIGFFELLIFLILGIGIVGGLVFGLFMAFKK